MCHTYSLDKAFNIYEVSLMLMRRYTNIPLPDELAKQIDSVIKTAELGYKTKSEFVKESVRERLIELGKFEGFEKRGKVKKKDSSSGSRNPKLILKKA